MNTACSFHELKNVGQEKDTSRKLREDETRGVGSFLPEEARKKDFDEYKKKRWSGPELQWDGPKPARGYYDNRVFNEQLKSCGLTRIQFCEVFIIDSSQKLKPHQEEGVAEVMTMIGRELNAGGSEVRPGWLIADAMGLGKTVTSLTSASLWLFREELELRALGGAEGSQFQVPIFDPEDPTPRSPDFGAFEFKGFGEIPFNEPPVKQKLSKSEVSFKQNFSKSHGAPGKKKEKGDKNQKIPISSNALYELYKAVKKEGGALLKKKDFLVFAKRLKRPERCVAVLVPNAAVPDWEDAIKTFLQDSVFLQLSNCFVVRNFEKVRLGGAASQTTMEFAGCLVVVVDEAHEIKNQKTSTHAAICEVRTCFGVLNLLVGGWLF